MQRISTRLATVVLAAAATVAVGAGAAAAEPNTPDRPGVAGGTWELRDSLSTGPATVRFGFGKTTDLPITGDWDGDGVSTPGIVRAVNGNWVWYLRNSNSAGAAQLPAFAYGKTYTSDRSGDIPVVGDWDGDGRDGIGLIREENGRFRWLLRETPSAGNAEHSFVFGSSSLWPVVWN